MEEVETDKLVQLIRSKKTCISVIGLGRVGLPTAAVYADAGHHVIGVDVRRAIVKSVSSQRIHTMEPGLEPLIKRAVASGRLETTANATRAVEKSDIVVVCVQTPLTRGHKPYMTYLKKACENIAQALSRGMLVVIESTVPPGTMKNIVAKTLEGTSNLRCGKDFWLAYCPERITPGKILQEFSESARIVGSFDTKSAEITVELLKTVTKGSILTADCATVELAKLAENAFRDVNIAFANELALISEHVDADAMEVIRLANTHPRVQIHKPGCGVGGPCLTKDPYLLFKPAEAGGFKSKVIVTCRNSNDAMPKHVVDLVMSALRKVGKSVKGLKIVVLGVAYKGETDDVSNTPARDIIRKLMKLGADIAVHDPYSKKSFGAKRIQDISEAVNNRDCLVLATDHKVYEKLDLREIRSLMRAKPVIVDCRRTLNPKTAMSHGFLYVGTGYVASEFHVVEKKT